MNTRRGKAKFKNFWILLDSVCSSTILMVRLVGKLRLEKYAVIQCYTQAGNITTNLKVKVYFTLPAPSAKNVMTWKYHVGDSDKGRYDVILVQDLFIELVLNLKFPEHIIKADDGTFKGSTTPMVDLGTYIFKILNTGEITPEESFTNSYVEEVYGSEHVRSATKQLCVILDAKYKKSDLHKFMETHDTT